MENDLCAHRSQPNASVPREIFLFYMQIFKKFLIPAKAKKHKKKLVSKSLPMRSNEHMGPISKRENCF